MCTRFRGWEADADPNKLTIHCEWTSEDPVSARMTLARGMRVVDAEDTLVHAEQLARTEDVRHLIVVSHDRLAGVMCRCDLFPPPRSDERVAERLRPDVFALDSHATLGDAAAAMSALHIGCLPVVASDLLVGVITRGDLRRVGIDERFLGADHCRACGSVHGVRPDPRTEVDYCLDCLDELDPAEAGERELGDGD